MSAFGLVRGRPRRRFVVAARVLSWCRLSLFCGRLDLEKFLLATNRSHPKSVPYLLFLKHKQHLRLESDRSVVYHQMDYFSVWRR